MSVSVYLNVKTWKPILIKNVVMFNKDIGFYKLWWWIRTDKNTFLGGKNLGDIKKRNTVRFNKISFKGFVYFCYGIFQKNSSLCPEEFYLSLWIFEISKQPLFKLCCKNLTLTWNVRLFFIVDPLSLFSFCIRLYKYVYFLLLNIAFLFLKDYT